MKTRPTSEKTNKPQQAAPKQPAAAQSNSEAQEQLPSEQTPEEVASPSLLDHQDSIVAAVGEAFTQSASNVTCFAQAPGGFVGPHTIRPGVSPTAALLVALLNRGIDPAMANDLSANLGSAIEHWFDGLMPGNVFHGGVAGQATQGIAAPGQWVATMPFLPAVELMIDGQSPSDAQTLGNAITAAFESWQASLVLNFEGVVTSGPMPVPNVQGGPFEVSVLSAQMLHGPWI
ncbi:MAG: hypothetical protein EP330_16855 [Deltaproteobacteria bacterium]|nr:MAG: hypothetical protein EP330_16855 [Deltaproteobacteria bacterium]